MGHTASAIKVTIISAIAFCVLVWAHRSGRIDAPTLDILARICGVVAVIAMIASQFTPVQIPPAPVVPAPAQSPTDTAIPSTPTSTAVTPTPTLTFTHTPTPTSSPTPTDTPTPPPPLLDIFPQASEGEAWRFENHGGSLSYDYVTDQKCLHSGDYGLLLTYRMPEEATDANGGWGVHWANAPAEHFDASGFTHLSFRVKGMSGSETFQIGIRDTAPIEVNLESKDLLLVSTDWTLLTVPLTKFTGAGVNSASIQNVHFGFNRDHGSVVICVDDIRFVE